MEELKRLDIMTDIETLGNRNGCCIFQIAAIAFDITTKEEMHSFNLTADISLETEFLNVNGSTLKWWLNTDKELLQNLLNKGEVSPKELIKNFNEWLINLSKEYDVYLWGNGMLFDNNIIRDAFEKQNLIYPIKYTNDRDMRTIVELAAIKLNKTIKEFREECYDNSLHLHDAFDDCRQQINIISKAYSVIMSN